MVGGLAGDAERAAETQAIVKWAFGAFDTVRFFDAGAEVAQADVWLGASPKVALVAPKDLQMLVPREDRAGRQGPHRLPGADRGADRRGPEARRARGRGPRPRAGRLRPRRRGRRAARRADHPDQRRRAARPATAAVVLPPRPTGGEGHGRGRASSASRASTDRASRPRPARSPRACARAAHDVVETREPGGAPGAELIRRLLVEGEPGRWSPETEILLFTAARRDHLERTHPPGARPRRHRDLRPLRQFDPRLPGRRPAPSCAPPSTRSTTW